MNIIGIKKKSGGRRVIYIPDDDEMASLRQHLSACDRAVEAHCGPAVHGFRAARSPVSNALAHAAHRYILQMDLQDFFDSIRKEQLAGRVGAAILDECLVDGAPRQGLPTSPPLANVAAAPLDAAICKAARKKGMEITYTRYADDLTISSDDPAAIAWAREAISAIVARCGWRIAEKKTRTTDRRYQRAVITGVALAEDGTAVATRRHRRRLRAALHSHPDSERTAGLRAWCQMIAPRERKPEHLQATRPDAALVGKLLKAWDLRALPRGAQLPARGPDEDLGEGTHITADPAVLLGPSEWGTSWTSCLRHHGSGHEYHRGTPLWLGLRGCRVAVYRHKSRTLRSGGVVRPALRARALVFDLRDGRRCYWRIYGESQQAIDHLRERLERAGYISDAQCRGAMVVGHVPVTWVPRLPYLRDGIGATVFRGRATRGPHAGKSVYTVKFCS